MARVICELGFYTRNYVSVVARFEGYDFLDYVADRTALDTQGISGEEFIKSELYQELCREASLGLRQAFLEYAEELKNLALSIPL